jgi:geranylgeranyl pyrophosphate synthase
MHPDTCAALRLLALALSAHPEDMATLSIYGDLPGHLADVIDDYIDDHEGEEE